MAYAEAGSSNRELLVNKVLYLLQDMAEMAQSDEDKAIINLRVRGEILRLVRDLKPDDYNIAKDEEDNAYLVTFVQGLDITALQTLMRKIRQGLNSNSSNKVVQQALAFLDKGKKPVKPSSTTQAFADALVHALGDGLRQDVKDAEKKIRDEDNKISPDRILEKSEINILNNCFTKPYGTLLEDNLAILAKCDPKLDPNQKAWKAFNAIVHRLVIAAQAPDANKPVISFKLEYTLRKLAIALDHRREHVAAYAIRSAVAPELVGDGVSEAFKKIAEGKKRSPLTQEIKFRVENFLGQIKNSLTDWKSLLGIGNKSVLLPKAVTMDDDRIAREAADALAALRKEEHVDNEKYERLLRRIAAIRDAYNNMQLMSQEPPDTVRNDASLNVLNDVDVAIHKDLFMVYSDKVKRLQECLVNDEGNEETVWPSTRAAMYV